MSKNNTSIGDKDIFPEYMNSKPSTDREKERAKDLITASRVRLQQSHPFFAYLLINLNPVPEQAVVTAGVDAQGNLYYNPKFISSLDIPTCQTLLAHEVMHIALLHLQRDGTRDRMIANIAQDIIINNLLINNNFKFDGILKKGFVPEDNEIKIGRKIIDNLDQKTFEEVYALIESMYKKKMIKVYQDSNGNIVMQDGKGNRVVLDINKQGKSKADETPAETKTRETLENSWKKKLAEAEVYSRQQGKETKGLDLHIDNLLNSKLNWREILRKYITAQIPFDFSYNRPSKRGLAIDTYLPSIRKDNSLEISIAVDTSGSIGQDDLKDFLSEINDIASSFSQININLMFWDTEIKEHYQLDKHNIEDLIKNKVSGGGGTDFKQVYNYLEDNIPSTKVLVFFTDGYADFPIEEKYKTIWVLSKDSIPIDKLPFGTGVKIE